MKIKHQPIGDVEAFVKLLGELPAFVDHYFDVYSTGAINPQTGERYEHKVMDDRHQAPIHRGRWRTVLKRTQESIPEIGGQMQLALRAWLENDQPRARTIIEALAKTMKEVFREYDDPPPNSSYIRTLRLQQSWRYRTFI